MPDKLLGALLIVLTLGLIITGILDPAIIEPSPNPVIDKLEVFLGIALVVFNLWAGTRLIRRNKI